MLGRMWWRMSYWLTVVGRAGGPKLDRCALPGGARDHRRIGLRPRKVPARDGWSIVFIDVHANIVAYGMRFDHEDWPPLWMAGAKVLKVPCTGRTEVGEGARQRS